jgi:hypothetical protein
MVNCGWVIGIGGVVVIGSRSGGGDGRGQVLRCLCLDFFGARWGTDFIEWVWKGDALSVPCSPSRAATFWSSG